MVYKYTDETNEDWTSVFFDERAGNYGCSRVGVLLPHWVSSTQAWTVDIFIDDWRN